MMLPDMPANPSQNVVYNLRLLGTCGPAGAFQEGRVRDDPAFNVALARPIKGRDATSPARGTEQAQRIITGWQRRRFLRGGFGRPAKTNA